LLTFGIVADGDEKLGVQGEGPLTGSVDTALSA
jgi:hypothetical protein